jgi:Peptidase family M28
MHAVLSTLSSDALQGRATFGDEIGKAAQLLADAYREAGIPAVGDDYRHGYTIVTGAKLVRPPQLELGLAGRWRSISAEQFVARSNSANGKLEGELAFVGYAMRSNEAEGTPSYDDLAGVDLKGRVAVVLLESPGRPATDELFASLRARVSEHEARLAPLRERNDTKAAAKEQLRVRRELAAIVAPYWRDEAGPAVLRAPATDPLAPFDFGGVPERLRAEAEALPGPKFDPRSSRLSSKLARLSEAGAIGAIVIEGPRSHVDPAARAADRLPTPGEGVRGDAASFPVVQLRWHEADALLRIAGKKPSAVQARIDRSLAPHSRVLAGTRARIDVELAPIEQRAENVLARIDGSDLADEIVILGAHFDHIGVDGKGGCHAKARADGSRDEICNGADDNASGTATVLELARAFAAAGVKPRRTLVFAHFSGEEIGLHGSKALAESPPKAAPFDHGKVVAMINLDMVGRLGDAGLAIGGIASSSGWMPLLEQAGTHGMKVIYERSVTSRSDHASFYRKHIPVLFFFTGLHADYHAPGDEIAGISREGMTEIAELVAELLLAAGNGAALPFSEPRTPEEGLTGALPGSNPATLAKPIAPAK